MKKITFVLLVIAAWATSAHAHAVKDSIPVKQGLQEIRIHTSAVCDMCKETLEKAMAYEKGVKASDLDVASKIITVKYDPKKTDPEKIRKAVSMAGYDADGVPANEKAYEDLNACCKKNAKHE